jgi:hypothetical protein
VKIETRLENLERKAKPGEAAPAFVLMYKYPDHYEDQHHRTLLPDDAKALQQSIRPCDLLLILQMEHRK